MKINQYRLSSSKVPLYKFSFLLFLLFNNPLVGQEEVKQDYSWLHCCDVVENVFYGADKDQRLDIYMQGNWIGEPTYFKVDSVPKPTLVFIHGGGWVLGSKEPFFNEGFFLHFLNRGWNVVNVEYRLGKNTAPQAADDAVCAVKWIIENAEKYFIDPDNIVLGGASAGGHLALIAGLMGSTPGSHTCSFNDEVKIKAIINWFGVSDLVNLNEQLKNSEWNYTLEWIGDPDKVAGISQKYSPIYYINSNTPPIITIHGDSDSIVPFNQAERLHKALEKAKIRNQLVALPGGKHMGFTKAQFQLMYEQIFSFLEAGKD